MWKLRPGWNTFSNDFTVSFRSDIKEFIVKLPESVRGSFFNGDEFVLPDHPYSNDVASVIKDLFDLGLLIKDINLSSQHKSLQRNYFAHIGLNPNVSMHSVRDSTVLVLGLGGIGSVVLEHLVSAGVQNFILLDSDVVEESNLERQLIYGQSSIGCKKTEAARYYILSRNPHASIHTIVERIDGSLEFERLIDNVTKIDFCAICIDEPPNSAFKVTGEVLWKKKIPFVHGGVMSRSGFWGPLFYYSQSRYSPDMYSIWDKEEDEFINDAGPLPICFSPYNSIIAAFLSADILHFLSGAYGQIDFSQRTYINFSTLSLQKLLPDKERKTQ